MNDVVNWLLDNENPEVKYRTMIELLDMPKDDSKVKKVYKSLLHSDILNFIMEKFDLQNKWEDINAFLALSEFGLTRVDVPIDNYIERIIKNIAQKSMKCAKILLLRNLVSLGYYEHAWVKEEINSSFSSIRKDGTFRCLDKTKKTNDSKLPDMGCYRQTTSYLLLAAELKKIGIVLPQFETLIQFYLNHFVIFHIENPEKVITKEMSKTFYPIDHVHIGLQMIMYALSILGTANHPNCEKAFLLLDKYKSKDGKYLLNETLPYPYFNAGSVDKPNKWITLYVLLSRRYKNNVI